MGPIFQPTSYPYGPHIQMLAGGELYGNLVLFRFLILGTTQVPFPYISGNFVLVIFR